MPNSATTFALSESVHQQARRLSWGQTYSQIGLGPFSGSFSSSDSGTIQFFVERMNREVWQSGQVPENKIGFGIPTHVGSNSYLCGERVDVGQLLVFSGASGFEFLSPQNFSFCGIEMDSDEINDGKLRQLTTELRRVFSCSRRAITFNAEERRVLSASFDSVYRRTIDAESLLAPADDTQVKALNRQMVGTVLDCLHDDSHELVQVVKHWEIVTHIRDLVKFNPQCPRTVAELTIEVGLSRRTLQNACRDILDVSPVQFLRLLRLNEVRQSIETASSVTDAATEYGFWHLGYFSRDYRKMFGEAPSTTLERYRRK